MLDLVTKRRKKTEFYRDDYIPCCILVCDFVNKITIKETFHLQTKNMKLYRCRPDQNKAPIQVSMNTNTHTYIRYTMKLTPQILTIVATQHLIAKEKLSSLYSRSIHLILLAVLQIILRITHTNQPTSTLRRNAKAG